MASCANAAVEALARGLALEFAPIRVNAVSPGLVDTPLWQGMKPERKAAFFADAVDKLPTRYVGQPADIAALVVACMIGCTAGVFRLGSQVSALSRVRRDP